MEIEFGKYQGLVLSEIPDSGLIMLYIHMKELSKKKELSEYENELLAQVTAAISIQIAC